MAFLIILVFMLVFIPINCYYAIHMMWVDRKLAVPINRIIKTIWPAILFINVFVLLYYVPYFMYRKKYFKKYKRWSKDKLWREFYKYEDASKRFTSIALVAVTLVYMIYVITLLSQRGD